MISNFLEVKMVNMTSRTINNKILKLKQNLRLWICGQINGGESGI